MSSSEALLTMLDDAFNDSRAEVDEVDYITINAESAPIISAFVDIPDSKVIKIGISIGVVKQLFTFAYKIFQTTYLTHRQLSNDLNSITRVLLIVKGDIHSVVNCRKEMILKKIISLDSELSLSAVLIKKNPKSPSLWHHRRWCLSQLKRVGVNKCVKVDLNLCALLAEQHAKNYYAWVHRLWAVRWARPPAGKSYVVQYQQYLQLLVAELLFSQNWMSSHVSDHSAIHHRTQIVQLLLAECQATATPSIISEYLLQLPIHTYDNDEDCSTQRQLVHGDTQYLFQHLFHVSNTLIRLRVGYEALWYDRRNLLKLFLSSSLSVSSKNSAVVASSSSSSSSDDTSGKSGDIGGSSSSLSLFRWSNVANTIHIDSTIDSSYDSISNIVHVGDGDPRYCDDQVYFHISQLLCDEAASISQLFSQEGNLPHAEERKQRIYSLRCFAHLLSIVLDGMDPSNEVNVIEVGGIRNNGLKGQAVWLQRECRLALRDIATYMVEHDPVNRYMYTYFQYPNQKTVL